MEKPENELGVLALFAQQCQKDGWEIVSVQVGFPDLVIRNEATGQEYRAELEFAASSFKSHRHDPRKVDLIICWENDWPDCPMTIWALSNGQKEVIRELPKLEAENLYLRLENEYLRSTLKGLKSELEQKIPLPKLSRGIAMTQEEFLALPDAASRTPKEVMEACGISQRSAYRWLAKAGAQGQ